MKILVVDDEDLLVKGIRFNLQNEGYEVITGSNGLEALQLCQSASPDLIVLDVMMPEMDGLTACSKIREFSDVPIILLTAKADDMDKLLGFENGADDYLTKPFNILEVKARMKAIMRRSTPKNAKEQDLDIIENGDVRLEKSGKRCYILGKEMNLTTTEFELMELLVSNPNKVYSREKLLTLVWGEDYPGDERTVDVHTRRLREKIETNPRIPIVYTFFTLYFFYCICCSVDRID